MILLDARAANDFFTVESLKTFSGATLAVFAITNGLYRAFGLKQKWIGLIISILFCLVWVYLENGDKSQYFVAVVNGFLVYATAGGSTSMLSSTSDHGDKNIVDSQALKERKFLSPWW